MDLLLGDDDTERQLLPVPASSKINGYCLHHQQLAASRPGWRAMSWQRDQWQTLLSFKPDTSKIPAGSTLLVQLMFDEVRSDWPEQAGKSIPHMRWNIACVGSMVSKCSAAQYASSAFTIMDSQMLGAQTLSMTQIRSLQATKALAWAKTTNDTCQNTSDASHATSISSQYAARGSTRIVPSQLGLYQSGEPLQFLVKADQARGTYYRPSKFRCAFRGLVIISYWYRPPSDGPC